MAGELSLSMLTDELYLVVAGLSLSLLSLGVVTRTDDPKSAGLVDLVKGKLAAAAFRCTCIGNARSTLNGAASCGGGE